MSRLFISIASTTAITQSSRPIPMLPSASQRGLPVISARLIPTSANSSPTSAPLSSSSTTGSSGFLVVRMNAHHVRFPRDGAASWRAVRSDQPFERDGDAEHAERPDRRLELVRGDQLLDPLVHGEQATEGEQHERDDERPEVALGAEAERVLLRGCLPGTLAAEEQQTLVAGVGDRVDRLGQHRRRAGDAGMRRTSRSRRRGWRRTRRRSRAACPQQTSRTAHTALVGMRTI